MVKVLWGESLLRKVHAGANFVAHGYTKGDELGDDIIGTFTIVYTVFSSTDAKHNVKDSHYPILAPLSFGFAVFFWFI